MENYGLMNPIRKMMFRIIPNCEEVVHRSWVARYNMPMSQRQMLGLKAHLLLCRESSVYEERLDWVSNTLAKVSRAPTFGVSYKIRPEVKEGILNEIEARLREDSESSDEKNMPDQGL